MPFSFARREREVLLKLEELSRGTVTVTNALRDFVKGFLEGSDIVGGFQEIKNIERRCDELRRGIISEVYKGLFLPDMREIIHKVSESVDKVINKCESVSKIIYYQRPSIPNELAVGVLEQLNIAIQAAEAFARAVESLFNEMTGAQELILEVERLEHDEDVVEGRILEELFKLPIPLEEKLQLKELVINVGDIVDRMEDASDILEVLLLKMNY